jgi:hypothetical protein
MLEKEKWRAVLIVVIWAMKFEFFAAMKTYIMVLLMMTTCNLMVGYRGSRRSMLSPSSGHACSTFCKLHIFITHRAQYDYEDLDWVKGREFVD